MRSFGLALLGALFLALPPAAQALVFTAESSYQIVLPDSYPNAGLQSLLRQGATVLRQAFAESLGVDFPIVNESQRDTSRPAIFLGQTAAARQAGLKFADLPDFSGLIAERGGNVFIVGNDRHRFGSAKPESGFPSYIMGSLKTMTVFMEEVLQTRFLQPGAVGIDFLPLKSAEIPDRLTRVVEAKLIFSSGRHASMLYDYAINDYGPGEIKTYGGHSYYSAVPKEKYGQSNPEYFILSAAGKRDTTGNHLCISNPEVQELIYAEAVKQLQAGAGTIEVAQTDGYVACCCEECKKFGGVEDFGEKTWILHRSLAERLYREYPDKKMLIICYPPNFDVPKTFTSFPPNVMIELCQYSPAFFEKWKNIEVPHGFMVYIYNWGWYQITGFTPKRTPRFCAEQVRNFLDHGVRGIYRCGHGELPALEGPAYYVYGKMLEDSSQSYQSLEDDYYRRAFAEAYIQMRTFFDAMHERLEIYSRLQGQDNKKSCLPEDKLDDTTLNSALPRNPRVLLAAMYTPEVLAVMERNLSAAEKMPASGKVRTRLLAVRVEFDYLKNLANILHLYNAYRTQPSWELFNVLAQHLDKRNELLDSYYDEGGRKKSIPGWPEVRYVSTAPREVLACNGRLAAPIDAPLAWNVSLLREKKILPGASVNRMTIKRAQGEIPAADFSRGAWAAVPWNELIGIPLGPLRDYTRFKAIYDQDNFYLGIESDLKDHHPHNAVGRDGYAWRQDALELVLDPAGNREQYYHFIINPLPNSFYDSVFGLVTDPIHPLFNKSDASWNGDWEYQTLVKDQKWYALFKIPFAALNCQTPSSGATWTLNLGRGAFHTDSGGIELSLWSPCLESMSFHDRDSFGEGQFE